MGTPLVNDGPLPPTETRPNVLAIPSSTVSRFVLLMAALLSSGLFVGTWIHNQMSVGADWLARVSECENQRLSVSPGATPDEILFAENGLLQCVAGAQQRLAWYAVGGLLLTLVAAVVVLAAAPTIIVHRRRLRPAGAKLAGVSERVAALAADYGMRRAPDTMVGTSRLRDAFSFGVPRRYAVALPPALAVRGTSPAFELLVRHELAHLARRDVLIAWSARSLWYVVMTLLALPFVVAIARGDLSVLPAYSWRAALLLAATVLASAGILRAREYDADLLSAGTPARRDALSALLNTSGRRPASGWRRLVMLHPQPSRRVEILANPARLARPSGIDAGIAGFLAAVTVPLLVSVFATVPSLTIWAYVVPAALVGPMMGATVGLALWRFAVVDMVAGTLAMRSSACRVAIGVSLGFFSGQSASLASVGTDTITGSPTPLLPVIGALALGGATVVVAGLGRLIADRSVHLSARSYTIAAIAISGTLFAFVLWAATTLTRVLEFGGWSLAGRVAAIVFARPAATAVVLVLAVAILFLLIVRPVNGAPGWAVEGGPPPVAPDFGRPVRASQPLVAAFVAGIAAAATILVFRLTAGPSADYDQQVQRFGTYIWVFAGAGAAAGLSLIVLHGLRGAGTGMLAAPVASTTAALGFVLLNTAFGGVMTFEFIATVIGPALPLSALLFVLGSLLALLPMPGTHRRLPVWLLVVLPALVSGTVAFAAISERDSISPLPHTLTEGMSVSDYVGPYAVSVTKRLSSVDQAAAAIDGDALLSPSERAQRIRAELVAPVDTVLQEAATVHPADEGLVRVHTWLVRGLQGNRQAFENFARAYETGDYDLFPAIQADRLDAQNLLRAWFDAVNAQPGS